MSLLDLDEELIALAPRLDVVYSPVASDAKAYPTDVDACLVEGAVNNDDNLALARTIRANTRVLVAFGDCAVTGNVTALRNNLPEGRHMVLSRAYLDGRDPAPPLPSGPLVPTLLEHALPVHAVVPVDVFLPGCPPPPYRIREVLLALLEGRAPDLRGDDVRFG
jgi:NAD-reducing hydrogenase small subunit